MFKKWYLTTTPVQIAWNLEFMATEPHQKCDLLNLWNHSFYTHFLVICTYHWSSAITQSSYFQSRIQKNWACKVILFKIVSCSRSDAWPLHLSKLPEIPNSWLQSHIKNATFWTLEITHLHKFLHDFVYFTISTLDAHFWQFRCFSFQKPFIEIWHVVSIYKN